MTPWWKSTTITQRLYQSVPVIYIQTFLRRTPSQTLFLFFYFSFWYCYYHLLFFKSTCYRFRYIYVVSCFLKNQLCIKPKRQLPHIFWRDVASHCAFSAIWKHSRTLQFLHAVMHGSQQKHATYPSWAALGKRLMKKKKKKRVSLAGPRCATDLCKLRLAWALFSFQILTVCS